MLLHRFFCSLASITFFNKIMTLTRIIMQLVHFYNADKKATLKNRKNLKFFLTALLKTEGARELVDLSYIFCSDNYLLEINRKFLQHDFYTDIVTFDLSSDKTTLTGEIYISIDRVKENSKTLGSSFQEELHRVIFHGALHLCGFKDKTRQQKVIMRNKEEQNLEAYFK